MLFILLVSIQYATFSQTRGTITGTITDNVSKQPLEFANVVLIKTQDSSTYANVVTGKKGKFLIEAVAIGNYIIKYSSIGYANNKTAPFVISAQQKNYNVGALQLVSESKKLDEVTVTSTKSLLNTSIDRKTYNVSQDIMATTGSASDVLKNVPSVEVDIDGQVSLRGSSDVMILINGRPSPLMGKSRAEALQQLPANSIDRIEVITNPSARYKPDGTSGIINIVMKKNIKGGWNGNITANAGNRDRFNSSVNLNYKPGKLNIFVNYNYRKDTRLRMNNIMRSYFDTTTTAIKSYYTENSNALAPTQSHNATIGADYNPNKNNNLGISFNYRNREQIAQSTASKFYYDQSNTVTSNYDRLRYDPELQKEVNGTAYWEHNFKGEDHTIRIEFNASKTNEKEDNHYTNNYYYPSKSVTYDNTLIKQGDNQQQLTIDYSKPIGEDAKLEAGYAGSFTQQDFDFYGEYYDAATAKFIADKIKTNRFLYKETIHAGYITYQKSLKKFGYSVGLRLEEALINGLQVTKDSTIKNDYFKIYPTVHLSYKLKGNTELQLNYSRRVHRPEGDDINPFPEYQDPYNVRAGNPKLLPEIIHSVEFGYKWQNKNFSFIPSLYYRYKQNGFTQITVPLNDSVLLTTQQNLSNDQAAGLELIFSAKAGSFFTANLSNNFFYNKIDASGLGYIGTKAIISMSINFNSSFAITKTTMLQLSSNYRSARLTPQGKNYPTFVVNTGIRQDLFKKKLSVTLTASDLFQTLKQKSELTSTYLHQVAIGTRDARIMYVGVSYRFGKVIKKGGEEKLQFDNNL